MYQNCKLGIVVPAYNEALLIGDTLRNMPNFADRVYVIDDASTDRTVQITKGFVNEQICLISHDENRGVGAAIVTGYRQSLEDGMDIVAVMAGDDQMDPGQLPSLLEAIITGKADYAKGNRLSRLEHRKGMSNWRFFGNWVLTFLNKIASGYWKIEDPQNGYTAITRDALDRINLDDVYPRFGYCNDLLIKLNVAECRVTDVSIPARYGAEKSKVRYGPFMSTVGPLLFRGLLWRLKTKYVGKMKD
jgi:glycosyltransferase involved in cell wall biosynthesis